MRASRPPAFVRGVLFPFIAGLIHAGLMVCAFPPVDIWPLVVSAPLPLIWAAVGGCREDTGKPRAACPCHPRWAPVWVSLGAVPLWAYEQSWVIDVSGAGYYPFVGGLAAFAGIFVWALRRAAGRWPRVPLTWLVPVVWVGVDVFRGEVAFSGYPWMLLPHPLIESNLLALPASIFGVYFVGFLVAMLSGAVADLLLYQRARVRPALAGIGAAGLVWVVTPLVAPLGPSGAGPLRIAVVQTNLPQDNKNEWKAEARRSDYGRFVELTRAAAAANPRPALIVWPETMFPGIALDPWLAERVEANVERGLGEPDTRSLAPMYRDLLALQKELGIPMLVGSTGYSEGVTPDATGRYPIEIYNSAYLIDGGAVDPVRYDKLKLTPFGEVMPYIEYWPWLQNKLLSIGANGMEFNLKRGTGPRAFAIRTPSGPVVIGTPICFEGTTPDVNRALARVAPGTPQVLVNLTNDGWFGRFDPGRWQHLQNARWRCVELGVPMVRAANTGVSCSIDGRGRLLKAGVEGSALKTNVDGVLLADVAPAIPRTIYVSVGRVFAWVVLAGTILLVLGTYVGKAGRLGRA